MIQGAENIRLLRRIITLCPCRGDQHSQLERERERERERETWRETEAEGGRETDRGEGDIERQRKSHTERERERDRERNRDYRDILVERERDRGTDREKQTHRQTYRQTYREVCLTCLLLPYCIYLKVTDFFALISAPSMLVSLFVEVGVMSTSNSGNTTVGSSDSLGSLGSLGVLSCSMSPARVASTARLRANPKYHRTLSQLAVT